MRICESSADTHVSEEVEGRGSASAGAEIPLQPMARQAVPLQPMEVHSGAEIHWQLTEHPRAEDINA